MKRKAIGLAVVLSATAAGAALAAPGPEAACHALAEQTRQALAMKKQGLPVDKAITALASQPVPGTVPPEQVAFYTERLPGAARFAYVEGMSGDDAAEYYVKQCRKGA